MEVDPRGLGERDNACPSDEHSEWRGSCGHGCRRTGIHGSPIWISRLQNRSQSRSRNISLAEDSSEGEGLLSGIGDEGGFAPALEKNEHGLELLVEAIERAGYSISNQIGIALDVAATEFFRSDRYLFDGREIAGEELSSIYSSWIEKFPIVSIEDPFSEDDWDSWISFTDKGHDVLVIGDDLYVTNKVRLNRGISDRASNSILIKPNQIGTVTETLEVMQVAKEAGFDCIISHRSGETSDSSISDLSAGTGCGWIKTGAPARSDRTSKYNQLLRINEHGLRYSGLDR